MPTANANLEQTTPTVTITVSIPVEVAPLFGSDQAAIGRRLLEQAAVEGYRSHQLSRGKVAKMLGLGWSETEEFLARHGCERHYDQQDLEEDRQTLNRILGPA